MYYAYLFYPIGSNQDPLGQPGLLHLLEHYLIIHTIEREDSLEASSLTGCSNHIYMVFAWKGKREREFWKKLLPERNIFFHRESSRAYLEQAKEEILAEMDYYKSDKGEYESFLLNISGEKYISPMGERKTIEEASLEDLEELYGRLPSPSYYEYDLKEEVLSCISFSQNPMNKEYKRPLVLFKWGKKGDKDFLCFPSIGFRSEKISALNRGVLKELYLTHLTRGIRKVFSLNGGLSYQSFLFDWNRAYICFDLTGQVEKGSLELAPFSLDSEEFHGCKEEIKSKILVQEEKTLDYMDLLDEVVGREIYGENKLFSSKEKFLRLLEEVSLEDFQSYKDSLGDFSFY